LCLKCGSQEKGLQRGPLCGRSFRTEVGRGREVVPFASCTNREDRTRGQMKQRMQKRREKNEAGPTARWSLSSFSETFRIPMEEGGPWDWHRVWDTHIAEQGRLLTGWKVYVGHALRWASDGRIHSRVSKARALCLRAAGGSPLVSRHIGPLWSGTAAGRELFGHNPAHGDAAGEAYQCGIRAEGGRSAKGGARMAQAQAGAKEWGKGVLHGRGGGSYDSTEEATKDRCPKRRSQKNQTVLRMPTRGHQRGRKASPQPSQRQRLGGVVRESGCNRS